MNNCYAEIQQALDKVAGLKLSYGGWTPAICLSLAKIASVKGYNVGYSGGSRCKLPSDIVEELLGSSQLPQIEGGWLYDFYWSASELLEGGNWTFRRMVLVAEIEWKTPLWQLQLDFEKLLQARSDYRLFVFEQENREMYAQAIAMLEACITNFEQSDKTDSYLLSCYVSNEQKFDHRVISVDSLL